MQVRGYTYDTMIAHNAVSPDEPHDLGHIAFLYTDAPPWKPAKKKGGIEVFESFEELAEYNGRDCVATSRAMLALQRDLETEQAKDIHDLDISMYYVALQMEKGGLYIDVDEWAEVSARCTDKMDAAMAKMMEIIGPKFAMKFPGKPLMPRSGPQMQWVLFDKAGPFGFVPPKPKTKAGNYPVDKAALLKLAQVDESGFIQALLQYKLYAYVKSNYIDTLKLHDDGRVRPRWKPTGARTGRWSTSPNVQNWPKQEEFLEDGTPTGHINLRRMVVAPPGRKIVGADLAQAELRQLAALSGDPELIRRCMEADENDKYNPDKDPHSFVAHMTFGDTYLTSSKIVIKTLRDLVKRCVYGMMYLATAETVYEAIYDGGYQGPPITLDMIQRTIRMVFKAFPRVQEYQQRVVDEANRTGYVWDSLLGRRREFPLRKVKPTIAVNFAIQSTVASMMNLSTWEFYQRLPGVDPSAFIIAQVHDAIYAEADEKHAQAVADLLAECMTQELQLVEGAAWMRFPAEATVADSWDKAG